MNTQDKELYNEKISGVHLAIESNAEVQSKVNENILSTLDRIEKQVLKTNGRVNQLEKIQGNCYAAIDLNKRTRKLEQWQWKSIGIGIGVMTIIGFIFKFIL